MPSRSRAPWSNTTSSGSRSRCRGRSTGIVRLRKATQTPVATGEKEWTLRDFKIPDPGGRGRHRHARCRQGGRRHGFKRIIDFAAAHGVRFTPHSWSSAINTAAALHLFASAANGVVFELKPNPSPMQSELVTEPIVQTAGDVEVPARPGLGIEVRTDDIQRYLMR